MMAQDFRRKVGRSDRQGGKQGTTHGRTARAAAFVALLGGGLLPGAVLAQSLTDLGLIDEYRLYFHPVVLGGGNPFFAGPRPPLRLTASERIGETAIRLTYVPA